MAAQRGQARASTPWKSHQSMVDACGWGCRACAHLSTPGGRRRPPRLRRRLLRVGGTFASYREPVEGVERGDHGHTEDGEQSAEQGSGREPRERELEAPADRRRACSAKGFAEQPVTARVLPDGIEGQRGYAEGDAL